MKWPVVCGCHRSWGMVSWAGLPLVAADPDTSEELRRCACGKELRASTEPPAPPSIAGGFQFG